MEPGCQRVIGMPADWQGSAHLPGALMECGGQQVAATVTDTRTENWQGMRKLASDNEAHGEESTLHSLA